MLLFKLYKFVGGKLLGLTKLVFSSSSFLKDFYFVWNSRLYFFFRIFENIIQLLLAYITVTEKLCQSISCSSLEISFFPTYNMFFIFFISNILFSKVSNIQNIYKCTVYPDSIYSYKCTIKIYV